MNHENLKWKGDWERTCKRFIDWWGGKGLIAHLAWPRKEPLKPLPAPPLPTDVEFRWTNPQYRCDKAEHDMARTFYAAEAFPDFVDMSMGPGSLGTFLGATPHFAPDTVWYEPCIADPDSFGPIRFDPRDNRWWDIHVALVDEAVRRSRGRYMVPVPDLIENLDTLSAMRGNENLLIDLLERPAWVGEKLHEINEAYFQAFDLLHERVRFDGGNAFCSFRIWGPGRTIKAQCDFSCMISPPMYAEFVAPALKAQCDWADQTLYHLDGVNALQHLDALLAIDSLDAIQWVPGAGKPGGGDPIWHDLYRRIRKGGKSVQCIEVLPRQVKPLLDAVGPDGLFLLVNAPNEAAGEQVLKDIEPYR